MSGLTVDHEGRVFAINKKGMPKARLGVLRTATLDVKKFSLWLMDLIMTPRRAVTTILIRLSSRNGSPNFESR